MNINDSGIVGRKMNVARVLAAVIGLLILGPAAVVQAAVQGFTETFSGSGDFPAGDLFGPRQSWLANARPVDNSLPPSDLRHAQKGLFSLRGSGCPDPSSKSI